MNDSDPFAPIHPAEILLEDFMQPADISVSEAAAKLGVSVESLQRFLCAEVGVTAELAERLERGFGSSAQFWLNLQKAYEDDVAGVPKRRIPVIGARVAAE